MNGLRRYLKGRIHSQIGCIHGLCMESKVDIHAILRIYLQNWWDPRNFLSHIAWTQTLRLFEAKVLTIKSNRNY
jgi:hypothetical protein